MRSPTSPLLIDFYCGAGGAAAGYVRAGFTVIGVDHRPQPHYPYQFIQADVLDFMDSTQGWRRADVIHASPPCQAFTPLRHLHDTEHPDLIAKTRDRIMTFAPGQAYVLENVPNSGLLSPVTVCGTSIGLRVRRHRWFESNVLLQAPKCSCSRRLPKVFPLHRSWYKDQEMSRYVAAHGNTADAWIVRWGMEMPWATREECVQAVPPAYTELLGWQLRAHLRRLG